MRGLLRFRVAILLLMLVSCCLTVRVGAAVVSVFYDDYDDQTAGSGPGFPIDYNFYGLGMEDRGVDSSISYSSSNSMYLSLNNGTTTWGVGLYKPISTVNMSSGVLSVATIRSDGFAGGIAFKVWDADGNEYRTDDADLYHATTGWTTFTQSIYDLSFQDAGGSALNVSNITAYGLVVYKAGSGTDTVNYYFDDFSATGESVPEPEVLGLFGAGVLLCALSRRVWQEKK